MSNKLYFTSFSTLNTGHSHSNSVQFGTRVAIAAVLQDENDDQKYQNPPVSVNDVCPNNTVQCDAVRDCTLGSDETNCGEKTHCANTHKAPQ